MNRIDRLSAIIIMLQSTPVVRVQQIATRFSISTRTVYRDIKALEEVGIPLAGGALDGYSLVDGYKLPPLMFTQEEAFAFLAAQKLVSRFTDHQFGQSYTSGIEKIRAVMRLAQKETIGNLDDKILTANFSQPQPAYSHNIMQVLMSGIAQHRQVQICYYSPNNDESTERLIDPIGIYFSLANWYVVAYCNVKKDYRVFRINRIQKIDVRQTASQPNHPPLSKFIEDMKNIETLEKVIVRFDKDSLSLVDESRYYQGFVSEHEVDDKVEMEFVVFSIPRFARWLLSYVDIVTVVYPPSLVQTMKDIILKSNL